ncbi:MAG: CatB-related O-acetyltransferase [Methylotenera sp.]|nr:CatB-related O-acetyltransferase [Methylotenera sp.]
MIKLFGLTNYLSARRVQRKAEKLRRKPARSLERFKKEYPNYKIGNNNYGVPNIKNPHTEATLSIGSFCSIAPNVKIYMGGMHRSDWITTYPFPAFFTHVAHIQNWAPTKGDVNIGNDVWLCANSVILSGVTIGHGAVVANSAVVTKDVAPYEIVGGNPAKHIRWRFDEATREALLESKWWDWPEDEVLRIAPLLCSDNLTAFFEYARSKSHLSDNTTTA